ncbi:MAG TPA: phosphomannomutase/phosphoglucomutase [Nakamurella sp.]
MLRSIVKAYDIRGLVGLELTPAATHALGFAFGRLVREAPHFAQAIVIGHDMRDSSPELARAFATGVVAAGPRVDFIGLASTDMLYFASGVLDRPGAMFTASHNPAAYNGIKLCLAGAKPISLDTGLAAIREDAAAVLDGLQDVPAPSIGRMVGSMVRRPMATRYADYLLDLVDLRDSRPLRVVIDAGNGMAGYTVPTIFDRLPFTVEPMFFELDGTFPNHEANPLDPANLVDLQARVRTVGADIGLAFDGDADRCFVVDERGEPVSPSAITALVATRELRRHPGSTVLYNLISSRAVPQIVAEAGGRPVRTRVGHSFIKAEMARTGALFGGEHSAHYYFADFYGADSGMLAALHVLAALGDADVPLSRLAARYRRYAASGEINSTVSDLPESLRAIRSWATARDADVDTLDGLTVSVSDDTWFNVRPSNTEPLLRLNVEAPTEDEMAGLREEILAVIRG